MQGRALGHRLDTLHDGLTTFRNGEPAPMPLLHTEIGVRILAGLAIIRTTRQFSNAEDAPIEAILTFPVGFDATVTELAATIDGRRMLGVAKGAAEARETYEAALDEGRLSVLHEEALRGIHVLSVGALPPGAQVAIELEQVVPLSNIDGTPFLRLPMTAGQIYGTSPLLPADDLVSAQGVRHDAVLRVTTKGGLAVMDGKALPVDSPVEVTLDHAIELRIDGGLFGNLNGCAADGRSVEVSLQAAADTDAPLDLHIIVDRSGSTNGQVRDGGMSVWAAMRAGLAVELAALNSPDRVALWQFDDGCESLGVARGTEAARLVNKLQGPGGGTELAGAIRKALRASAKDILVLTDGQTWAHMVDELKAEGPRISAILVGPGSLDANIGHLCAITGGQVLFAPGRDVASSLRTAFKALRNRARAIEGKTSNDVPTSLTSRRGGVNINVTWHDSKVIEAGSTEVAIGRFAASLALPLLDASATEAWSRAHSLCTHTTSLVLVDEIGEASEGFSRMRKVPLMAAIAPEALSRPQSALHHSSSSLVLPMMRESSTGPSVLGSRMPKSRSQNSAPPAKWMRSVGSAGSLQPMRDRGGSKRLLAGLLAKFRGKQRQPVEALFSGFAWDVWGDNLLTGDISSLTAEQQNAVLEIEDKLQDFCSAEGREFDVIMPFRIYALGFIARLANDRLGDRFAKRALKNMPAWLEGWTG